MNIFTANNQLHKSLVNFAKKLNLEIDYDQEEQRITVSELTDEGEPECEWLYSYGVGSDGSLYYTGYIYFPEREELPGTIFTASKVKELLTFTADTMKVFNAN